MASNAWKRQLTFPSGGYVSNQPQLWADVRTKDANVMVTDRQLKGKRNLFGDRVREPNAELRARGTIRRLTATNRDVAAWWRALTPAQANAAVDALAAQL